MAKKKKPAQIETLAPKSVSLVTNPFTTTAPPAELGQMNTGQEKPKKKFSETRVGGFIESMGGLGGLFNTAGNVVNTVKGLKKGPAPSAEAEDESYGRLTTDADRQAAAKGTIMGMPTVAFAAVAVVVATVIIWIVLRMLKKGAPAPAV